TNLASVSAVAFDGTPSASFGDSIWDFTAVPAEVDAGDPAALEIGMQFSSDLSGLVTGLQFYKSPANTGTHTRHLWTGTGVLLASVTFSDETASGWQRASFPTPVWIAPGVTYVISYHTDTGHYSADIGGFAGQSTDNAPLHALASSGDTGNGVYVYG